MALTSKYRNYSTNRTPRAKPSWPSNNSACTVGIGALFLHGKSHQPQGRNRQLNPNHHRVLDSRQRLGVRQG